MADQARPSRNLPGLTAKIMAVYVRGRTVSGDALPDFWSAHKATLR
jgi:predicted transcriptional regulator